MSAAPVVSNKEIVKSDSAASPSIAKQVRLKIPDFKSFSEPRVSSRGLVGRVTFNAHVEKTPLQDSPESQSVSSSIDWSQCVTPSPSREADEDVQVNLEPIAVDTVQEQIKALDGFLNAFLELGQVETPDMAQEITIQFSNLDIKNQRLVRGNIERVLIKYGPDFTPEELEKTVEEVIHNPFIEIEDEKDAKHNILVMSTATIEARRSLQRVMEKFERRGTSMEEVAQVATSLEFDDIEIEIKEKLDDTGST